VGQSATATVSLKNASVSPVQITQIGVSGQYFSLTGTASTMPMTLAGGVTYTVNLQFSPTAAGTAAGDLTIANDSSSGNLTLPLSGTASVAAPATTVTRLSCATGSLTGAGTDVCTVAISAAAGSSGTVVSLASSSSAVTVPSSVTVLQNATSATFTLTAGTVSAAQTATVTATAGGSSSTFSLQLNPVSAPSGTAALSLSASSLSFGDVTVNAQSTQYVTVTSSGTAPLVVNSATAAGSGFSVAGPRLPVTLYPGNAVTLQVRFSPASAGSVTGTLTLATNAAANGTAVVNLSGIGDAAAGALSSLFCNNGSITGAGSTACTIGLSAAAPAGGLTVNLASNSQSLSVPATVTIAAGNLNAFFTATATAVGSAQTANITATSGSISKIFAVQLLPQAPALRVSTSSLNFGSVNLNASVTQTVVLTSSGNSALTLNAATLAGTGFTMTGATFPVTLNPGRSVTLQVTFTPTAAGAATGSLTVTSDASANGTVTVSLSGNGQSTAGTLSSLSCNSATMTGAGTDTCRVTLSAAAPTGGLAVTLASNDTSTTVPSTVTVQAGSTTATFTATVSAVTSPETDTLSATAGGVTKVFGLQLNPQTAALSLSTTALNFGDINVNTTTTQSVTLTSTGTAAVTIDAATLSGTGFTMAGASFPVTLQPGQSATLQVTFAPTAAGAVTGSILITSNATANPTSSVSLSGTGDLATSGLSSLTCTTTTYTAAGTDACTVTLSAAAPTGGLVITLASDNASVTVPASITVAAGSTTNRFTATIATFTTTQTATLTATANGVAKTFIIQMNDLLPGLTLGSTSIDFGSVTLNTPATQTLSVVSSGTATVNITAVTIAGTGFTVSGITAPVALTSGQSATLDLQFDPTTAGPFTGTITIVSDAGTSTVALTGTGVAATGGGGGTGGIYSLPNDNNGCPSNCREIPWQTGSDLWNGGTLPVYPSVTCTGLAGNGTTNDGPAIQACINNAAPNTAVYLPAGTYYVNSTVALKSNVVLRGAKAEGGPPFMPAADPGSTTLLLGSNAAMTTQNFSASTVNLTPATTYGQKSPGYKIANAPKKGDTTFTIGSGTLQAGDWVSLFADNDPTLVNSNGTDGACPWCGENTGYNNMIQIDQVTAVNGTTATLARPFYYTLYTNPQYRIYTFPTQKAGYENLRFDASQHDLGSTQIILLQGCLYCWVKSVETYMSGSNSAGVHMEMDYSYGDEIRDSAFHDQRSGASGSGYGVYFQFANSDHKVENNILYHNRHSTVFQGGGSGIAILYNYIDDMYTDDLTYLGSARTSHGAHPYMNLWEGNIVSHVAADDFSGTSSHTVFFRNWIWGGESNHVYAGGSGIPSFPPGSGFNAVDLYTGQNYYSFVDNVLGNPSLSGGVAGLWSKGTLNTFDEYSGPDNPTVYSMGGSLGSTPASSATVLLQGNYDYLSLGVAYGAGDTYSPSLYYSNKPSFLGTCPFPEQGSDLAPVDTLLQPAYQRAMGTACP
jgi:hypothetical protein